MASERYDPLAESDVTTFVAGNAYVLGVGETIDEVQLGGEWLLTDEPVAVRR